MKKIRVEVKKTNENSNYVCFFTPNGWKCGRCSRGLLGSGEIGTECKVCHAIIVGSIEDSPEYHRKERRCALCHEVLVEGETLALHYKYGECKPFA